MATNIKFSISICPACLARLLAQLPRTFAPYTMLDHTLWDLQDELCASTSAAVPLSFSDTCSPTSVDTPLTPPHNNSQSIHVICDVPLVAPIPLPCYYPSFLRSDPPDTASYTRRVPKRKRGVDESNDDLAPKRRLPHPPLATSHHIQRSRQRRHPASIGDSGPSHRHV